MKHLTILSAFIFISSFVYAGTEIPVDSAQHYIGKTITICSKVYGVKAFDKVTLINVGAAFPNSPLTITIFSKDLKNFSEEAEKLFTGKSICVTGSIKMFKGKPEMIVSKPEDIVVQQDTQVTER
jgi:DNA/RNA endonuclease YhcR with UshA esterase domain